MLIYGVPVLYTVLLWWFATGAVLYMVGLPRKSHLTSMAGATAFSVAAACALYWSRADASFNGALIAFTAALLLWGWHELSFLTGYVTGPRTTRLPDNMHGAGRFRPAAETVIYHELALFGTLIALGAGLYNSPNQTGFWTFFILWAMRLSAKLNLYLGVPNLSESFLPDHLSYLASYFRRRPMNMLFPASVSAATFVFVLLVLAAGDGAASEYTATNAALLASILGLGILEHWFMVLPIPAEKLWTWGLASRKRIGLAAKNSRSKINSAPLEPVRAAKAAG